MASSLTTPYRAVLFVIDSISSVVFDYFAFLHLVIALISFVSTAGGVPPKMEHFNVLSRSTAVRRTSFGNGLPSAFLYFLRLLHPCFSWCTRLCFCCLFYMFGSHGRVFLANELLQSAFLSYVMSRWSYFIDLQSSLRLCIPDGNNTSLLALPRVVLECQVVRNSFLQAAIVPTVDWHVYQPYLWCESFWNFAFSKCKPSLFHFQ